MPTTSTRLEIRTEIRNDLRIDPNGAVWSDTVLDQLIHEAELEVARRHITITELETTSVSAVTRGTRIMTLPTDFLRAISVIYDPEVVTTYSAATISFTTPDTISDTAVGLGGFSVGDKLQILGTTSNDVVDSLTVATVAAGAITTTEQTITTEAAGTSFTIIGTSDPDHQQSLALVPDIRSIEGNGFGNIAGYPSKYAVFDASLYFDTLLKEADNVKVTYIKLPQEMAADSGATGTSDIPDELIPLVRLFAEYRAWYQLPDDNGKSQTALQRFEREFRRMVTMRGLNDYQLRKYPTTNWRVKYGY